MICQSCVIKIGTTKTPKFWDDFLRFSKYILYRFHLSTQLFSAGRGDMGKAEWCIKWNVGSHDHIFVARWQLCHVLCEAISCAVMREVSLRCVVPFSSK